jgi:hypothetical protein
MRFLSRDPVAHYLACAECHHPAGRNRDLNASFRIAADPLPFVAKDEAAEAGDLHVLADGERVAHVMQDPFDQVRGFSAGKTKLVVDYIRQVGAGQGAAQSRFSAHPCDAEVGHLFLPL